MVLMHSLSAYSDLILHSLSAFPGFQIDDATFEVGGKNKGAQQLRDAAQGFIVRDDLEYGHGNIIPLWAFGLNY